MKLYRSLESHFFLALLGYGTQARPGVWSYTFMVNGPGRG